MKKLLSILIIFALWSCSTDDPLPEEFTFEILPIISVSDMPDSVNFNETYIINYTYALPTTCHSFSDLYYLEQGDVRTVAVISRRINEIGNIVCEDLAFEEIEGQFTFTVLNTGGTYIFKFWQGVDNNGEDEYLIYEVPIN